MARKRDIEAGAAFVRLFLKDDMSKALQKVLHATGRAVQDVGQKISNLGKPLVAFGAAATTAFGGATALFASAGSALSKLSIQTGESVENLSALQHAARKTGVEFDDVAGAMEENNIRIGEAFRDGTGPAVAAIEGIGLTIAELEKMNPGSRLEAIADGLNSIKSETQRGFLADEIFGGDAFKIMPLLNQGSAGIRQLTNEARELGLVMGGEDAKAAKDFSEAMGDLKAQVGGVIKQIGAAVAKPLTEWIKKTRPILANVIKWAKENKPLIATIAKVSVGVLALGAALVTAGTAVAGLGMAISGLGTILGVVLSPLALITAALTAGVVAWAKWTDSGKDATKKISSALRGVMDVAKTAFGGIKDALKSGDLELAADIAMTGIRLAVLKGLGKLSDLFGDTIGTSFKQILAGDFEGAWNTVIKGLTTVWKSFSKMVVTTFTKVVGKIVELARGMIVDVLQKARTASNAIAPVLATKINKAITGLVGGTDEIRRREMQERIVTQKRIIKTEKEQGLDTTSAEQKLRGMEIALNAMGPGNATKGAVIDSFQGMVSDALMGANERVNAATGILSAKTNATAGKIQGVLDELDAIVVAEADAAAKAAEKAKGAGKGKFDELIKKLQEELQALVAQAANQAAGAGGKPGPGKPGAGGKARALTAGAPRIARDLSTFSASAAIAAGYGMKAAAKQNPLANKMDAVVKAIDKRGKDQETVIKGIRKELERIKLNLSYG